MNENPTHADLTKRIRELEDALSGSIKVKGELLESEERFRLAFENASIGMCLIDMSGRLVRVNRQMVIIFGYGREELERMNVRDFVQPEDPDIRPMFIGRASSGKVEYTRFEKQYLHREGHMVWCQVTSSILRNSKGVALFYISHVQDVTEQKHTEETLIRAKDEWMRIFQAIGYPTLILDLEHRILDANDMAVKAIGKEAGDLIGRPCYEFFHGSTAPPYTCPAAHLLQSHSLEVAEMEVEALAGTYLISCTPVFDGKGKLEKIIHIAMDISSRKRAEEEKAKLEAQLQQSQKIESVGRLAGGVAHDFNNILSIILGYADLLMENLPGGYPHKEAIGQIHAAGMRARSLTRQLLAFARRQVLEEKRLDLGDAVRGFESLLRRLIGEDILIDLVLTPEPLPVMADVSQLEQILMNLAVNARDAMPEGGCLTIETAPAVLDGAYAGRKPDVTPGRYALLAVSDTGTGMAPGTLEHIFEPFFTTKSVDKGTGLGLSTVYGIVKQHHGNIWAYSEPGEGTTFKIYLPLAAEEPKPETMPGELREAPLSGNATVLVVEDDRAVRLLACRILERGGYDVIESADVENAVQLARNHQGPLHLVLTDVVMPGMKGPEVYRRISMHHPEAKVLYMSGYTENAIVKQGVLAEGIHFIQKPFSVKAFLKKVTEVLSS